MDGIYAEHTRPIQSYNEKNMKEMMDYRKRYGLRRDIKEYGFEVLPEEELRQGGFEVTDRASSGNITSWAVGLPTTC